MKPESPKINLQTVNFEKRSAIIQCHINNKRMWILNKNGDFDYYPQIGIEPPIRISIKENVTPRKLWSNQRGTRFIIETIDYSLYYFQTSDTASSLFYPEKPKMIGMKNFFRIGSLKNGPVSTVLFDDDPQDSRSTKQVFIIVKGGGVLILSIDTIQNEATKEPITIISDFYTFPTLFSKYNILDMKIFRFIERKPDEIVLDEIKKKIDLILSNSNDFEKNFRQIIDPFYKLIDNITEIVTIFKTAEKKIETTYDTFTKFQEIYKKVEEVTRNTKYKSQDEAKIWNRNHNNNDFDKEQNDVPDEPMNQATEQDSESSKLLTEIERFINQERDFDIQYFTKISEDPNKANQNLQLWNNCMNTAELVHNKASETIENAYKLGYLFEQLRYEISRGKIKDMNKLFYVDEEDADTNNPKSPNSNEEEPNSSRSKKSIENENQDENDENDEEEDASSKKPFKPNFDLEFRLVPKSNKKSKKEEKRNKNDKIPEELKHFRVSVKTLFKEIRLFLKSEKMPIFEKITDFRQALLEKNHQIEEINSKIGQSKAKIERIFKMNKIQIKKFDENYIQNVDENFPFKMISPSEEKYFSYDCVDCMNKQVKSMLNLLKEKAAQNLNFIEHLNSFCQSVKPFFEDVNLEESKNNPFNVVENYIIILAEDRIIRYSSEKDPVQIFKAINKEDKEIIVDEFILNEFNNIVHLDICKFDTHSRLIHKPIKTVPSFKKPSFYVTYWDKKSNCNYCCSFKIKRCNRRKNNHEYFDCINEDGTSIESSVNNSRFPYYLRKSKEILIFKIKKTFQFQPNMSLIYYQITPSGLLVVQNAARKDSKAIAYEISSFIYEDLNVSSLKGKILWKAVITDYSLLPIVDCDYSLNVGLIIYNSMNIKLIKRDKIDKYSFDFLIKKKNPKIIIQIRKYLALTPEQEKETFFILLVYAMDQLYQLEKEYINCKRHKSSTNNINNNEQINLELTLNVIVQNVFNARNALTKLLNTALCSKMEIFLFLMNDKKMNDLINFYTEDKNDDKHFERFRRFRIEFVVSLLESVDNNRHQKQVLLLMALDLLMQCYSTGNNKCLYESSSFSINFNVGKNRTSENYDADNFRVDAKIEETNESSMNLYFKKSFTDIIELDDITSLTNTYGTSLSSPSLAYYIIKCFPKLDPASFYSCENESFVENTYSKVYKYLVKYTEKECFVEASELILNFLTKYYEEISTQKINMAKRNSIEIDNIINCLYLFGIEQHSKEEWFINNFAIFFNGIGKLIEMPKIPKTILSLFVFICSNKLTNSSDAFGHYEPLIQYMELYFKKNPQKRIDLLFSIYISMDRLKELESLRKSGNFDMMLAIYRLSKLRVQAAKLLEQLDMTAVAIDVVLDDKSPTTAIKFASSLKDKNTMLYLVRTASRKNENFDAIYSNVVDSKRSTSSNQSLYDVLMCIPENKLNEMKSLQESIFKKLEEIDEKSNKELEKIHSLHDKMKSKADVNDSSFFTLSSPFSSCDFCHNTILKNDFYVFPCGHAFHSDCYQERSKRDQIDREKSAKIHPNSQKFTTNENQCLCPLCGLGAIELIDTPLYSFLDGDKEVAALYINERDDNDIHYINEGDDDDDK